MNPGTRQKDLYQKDDSNLSLSLSYYILYKCMAVLHNYVYQLKVLYIQVGYELTWLRAIRPCPSLGTDACSIHFAPPSIDTRAHLGTV